MSTLASQRDLAVLVAPLVTLSSVVVLLLIAHFYERSPVQVKDCRFENRTGIPCPACGGTRSFQALANGEVRSAVLYHPFFALGALLTPLWAVIGILHFLRGKSRPTHEVQSRRFRIGAAIVTLLLAANWIYLIFFLP